MDMNFNDLSNNVWDEGRQHGGLHVKLCWKLCKNQWSTWSIHTQSVSYLWCVIVAVYSVHWHGLIESGLVQTGSVLQREKKACSFFSRSVFLLYTNTLVLYPVFSLAYLAAESCGWVSVSDCGTSSTVGGVGGRLALSSSSRLLWFSCSSS